MMPRGLPPRARTQAPSIPGNVDGTGAVDVALDVALVPAEAREADIAIVVDQIRASTTITTILDAGIAELVIAPGVAAARRMARETGAILAGEHEARMPRGFDYDNSPSRLSQAALGGRRLILCSTNGTRVLGRVQSWRHVLVGCLRNADAVAEAAVALAQPGATIQVICAGSRGRFVLEDAVAAGSIVSGLCRRAGAALRLTDAAAAALRLYESFPDPQAAIAGSEGAETLRRIGAIEDIAYCAVENATRTVPMLQPGSPMRLAAWDGSMSSPTT
jgi:2-phosphosulfolactate phosphatase